jgi:hypothetical protein
MIMSELEARGERARSSLPERLLALGPLLGAAEADVAEFASVQQRELAARSMAMMPQRQGQQKMAARPAVARLD